MGNVCIYRIRYIIPILSNNRNSFLNNFLLSPINVKQNPRIHNVVFRKYSKITHKFLKSMDSCLYFGKLSMNAGMTKLRYFEVVECMQNISISLKIQNTPFYEFRNKNINYHSFIEEFLIKTTPKRSRSNATSFPTRLKRSCRPARRFPTCLKRSCRPARRFPTCLKRSCRPARRF